MLNSPFPYIICYDLKQPIDSYQKLFSELQASHSWWHYLASTWIVLRYESFVELLRKLRPLIYAGDRLLVMPAKGPADGWLSKDAWDWINKNVPSAW